MVGRVVLPRPFIVLDSTSKAAARRAGLEEASHGSGWSVALLVVVNGHSPRFCRSALAACTLQLVRSTQSHVCGRGSRRPVAIPNWKLDGHLGRTIHSLPNPERGTFAPVRLSRQQGPAAALTSVRRLRTRRRTPEKCPQPPPQLGGCVIGCRPSDSTPVV